MRQLLTDLRGNLIYPFAQRRRTNHLENSSTLFFLVRNRSWDDVVRRTVTHPHEILLRDNEDGSGIANTALHLACRLDPPPAVVKALAACARVKNREGATPLHVAASHRCSPEALRNLIEAGTEEMERDEENEEIADRVHPTAELSRMGRAPIHYACMSFRGLELDAFRVLFDETLRHGNVKVDRLAMTDGYYYNEEQRDDLDEFTIGTIGEDEISLQDGGFEMKDSNNKNKKNEFVYFEKGPINNSSTNDNANSNNMMKINVLSMKDATGQTPLSLLFRRYRERVRCVIRTIDRIRREQAGALDDRAALAAAIHVHADLGSLWETSRWMVSRLTEERLQRELEEEEENGNEKDCLPSTETRTTSKPKAAGKDAYELPGEYAVAQEAAAWAAEHLRRSSSKVPFFSSDGLENNSDSDSSSTKNDDSSGEGRVRVGFPQSPTIRRVRDGQKKISPRCPLRPLPRRSTFRIVHASVGLMGYGCPPELVRLAISMHPRQVLEMDEDGNLPLHIACAASSYLVTADQAQASPLSPSTWQAALANVANVANAAGGGDGSDEISVLSDTMSFFSTATVSQTTNPFDKVIKILLEHCPEAARVPQGKTGQLPLVVAVEAGQRTWQDGVRTLLNAYPPALCQKKTLVAPKLFPHILALVGCHCSPNATATAAATNATNYPLATTTTAAATTTTTTSATDMDGASTVLSEEDLMLLFPRHSSSFRPGLSKSTRKRQEACAQTTLFELLRTKPDWWTEHIMISTSN